jgi:cytochrome c oxidase subunit 2
MKFPVYVHDSYEDYVAWMTQQETWLKQNPDYLKRVPAELREVAMIKAGLPLESVAAPQVTQTSN